MLNRNKVRDERGEWTYERAGIRSVIDYGMVNSEVRERVEIIDVVSMDRSPLF